MKCTLPDNPSFTVKDEHGRCPTIPQSVVRFLWSRTQWPTKTLTWRKPPGRTKPATPPVIIMLRPETGEGATPPIPIRRWTAIRALRDTRGQFADASTTALLAQTVFDRVGTSACLLCLTPGELNKAFASLVAHHSNKPYWRLVTSYSHFRDWLIRHPFPTLTFSLNRRYISSKWEFHPTLRKPSPQDGKDWARRVRCRVPRDALDLWGAGGHKTYNLFGPHSRRRGPVQCHTRDFVVERT